MQISNTMWERVSPGNNDKFIVQNVGDTRIAFIISDNWPDDDQDMDDGSHGVLLQGSAPFTVNDLSSGGLDMYVRSLGPKDGLLYVS